MWRILVGMCYIFFSTWKCFLLGSRVFSLCLCMSFMLGSWAVLGFRSTIKCLKNLLVVWLIKIASETASSNYNLEWTQCVLFMTRRFCLVAEEVVRKKVHFPPFLLFGRGGDNLFQCLVMKDKFRERHVRRKINLGRDARKKN